jgi:limonene-1,2-epoxide hydrolase
MSELPTTQAFIIRCNGWDEKALAHPILRHLKLQTEAWDSGEAKKGAYTDWMTEDVVYRQSDGSTVSGEAAFKAMLEKYAPLSGHEHEPKMAVVWETADGWEVLGEATLFADLPVPGGEKKHTNVAGRKWDIAVPGVFRFVFVKDSGNKHGYRAKRQEVSADSAPIMIEMIKRGMVKPEQLLG